MWPVIIAIACIAATIGLLAGCLISSARCNDCAVLHHNEHTPTKRRIPMPIMIPTDAEQQSINDLRIDLAQASIDLTELRLPPGDKNSQALKERLFDRLRSIGSQMDALGIQHACARRCAHVGG